MVAENNNTKEKKFSDTYKNKIAPARLENLALMKIVLKKLSLNTKKEIRLFRKLIKKILKTYPTKDIYSIIEQDQKIKDELEKLTNLIFEDTLLPRPIFNSAIIEYILNDSYIAPLGNLIFIPEEDHIRIEIYKKPRTEEWYATLQEINWLIDFQLQSLKRLQDKRFNVPNERISRLSMQGARIDKRQVKNIDRKLKSSQYKDPYSAIDSLFPNAENEPELDKQRLNQIRTDKYRLKKLASKISRS